MSQLPHHNSLSPLALINSYRVNILNTISTFVYNHADDVIEDSLKIVGIISTFKITTLIIPTLTSIGISTLPIPLLLTPIAVFAAPLLIQSAAFMASYPFINFTADAAGDIVEGYIKCGSATCALTPEFTLLHVPGEIAEDLCTALTFVARHLGHIGEILLTHLVQNYQSQNINPQHRFAQKSLIYLTLKTIIFLYAAYEEMGKFTEAKNESEGVGNYVDDRTEQWLENYIGEKEIVRSYAKELLGEFGAKILLGAIETKPAELTETT